MDFKLVSITIVAVLAVILIYCSAIKKCKHKFASVQGDGHQYCQKCGVGREPILKSDLPCSHTWVDKTSWEITRDKLGGGGSVIGTMYVLTCSKCGEIKHHQVKLG